MADVKDLRLLIGNTATGRRLNELAEGYQCLELVADAAESQPYPERTETQQMAAETATNVRPSVELMDQTDQRPAVEANQYYGNAWGWPRQS